MCLKLRAAISTIVLGDELIFLATKGITHTPTPFLPEPSYLKLLDCRRQAFLSLTIVFHTPDVADFSWAP